VGTGGRPAEIEPAAREFFRPPRETGHEPTPLRKLDDRRRAS